nr:hypothetical protein [uncultured Eisenbergiella sp.]
MEEKKKQEKGLYMDRLLFNGMKNPLGISGECVLLQWIIAGRGENILQQCCRIQIARQKDFTDLVYEDILYSGDTQWEIKPVTEEKTKYFWRVRACIGEGEWLGWSTPASFETAMKGDESWTACWIEADDAFYRFAGETGSLPCMKKEWFPRIALIITHMAALRILYTGELQA